VGSSFQYNILAGFRAVDALQQTLVQNVQGLLIPGYNRQKRHIGTTGGSTHGGGQLATQTRGSANPVGGGGDSLTLGRTTLEFDQGTIDPAFNPSSLAIRGPGFFLLAENDRPGAKVFLTRNGDFRYDDQGRLVNANGLFVVGGGGRVAVDADGRLVGPPPFVRNPGDGTVSLPTVSLAKVADPSQLTISGYGATTYALNAATGPLSVFPNGRQPEVGFIQANSIEMPDRIGWAAIFQAEAYTATQTYKIFKDMLTEFNKTNDDAIGLVK
jgi:flagellar basal body rod protein FlgG